MEEKFIFEIKNSIPDRLCNEIILMYELENIRFPGCTMGGVQKNIKDTTDLIIPKKNIKWNKIENFLYNELNINLKKYLSHINNHENNIYIDSDNLTIEYFMIQKYDQKIGKYTYHNDFRIDYNEKKNRVITFIWYLNNIDEGGETEFFNLKKIIPETGKLLLFPASWLFPHRAITPYSSDKYIITGWFYIKY